MVTGPVRADRSYSAISSPSKTTEAVKKLLSAGRRKKSRATAAAATSRASSPSHRVGRLRSAAGDLIGVASVLVVKLESILQPLGDDDAVVIGAQHQLEVVPAPP